MAKNIRVLFVAVGKPPEIRDIDTDLETMQKLVGGYVEHLSIGDFDFYCNEEAQMLNLPLNRLIPARAPEVPPDTVVIKMDPNLADPGQMGVHMILGDFFICRHNEAGEDESLTPAEALHLSKWISSLPTEA